MRELTLLLLMTIAGFVAAALMPAGWAAIIMWGGLRHCTKAAA